LLGPFLAVVFSVLKVFGVHHQAGPVLGRLPGPKGQEITQQAIGFADNLRVGSSAASGWRA
jgi:hypothetical protein